MRYDTRASFKHYNDRKCTGKAVPVLSRLFRPTKRWNLSPEMVLRAVLSRLAGMFFRTNPTLFDDIFNPWTRMIKYRFRYVTFFQDNFSDCFKKTACLTSTEIVLETWKIFSYNDWKYLYIIQLLRNRVVETIHFGSENGVTKSFLQNIFLKKGFYWIANNFYPNIFDLILCIFSLWDKRNFAFRICKVLIEIPNF